MAKDTCNIILARVNGTLVISKSFWAEALLIAGNYGWKQDRMSLSLLASEVDVTDDEALAMLNALEKLFDTALSDPIRVYPGIRVDMGELYKLKDFIEGSSFKIRPA